MRKYLTVILCALMLCSCADSTAEETESVTIPSETTAVPSAAVTENTTSVQTEKAAEIPFRFNYDVSYREEYLLTRYSVFSGGEPVQESVYQYDKAGNLNYRKGAYGEVFYRYDYAPDGTYTAVHLDSEGSSYTYSDEIIYDENGFILKDDHGEYTYDYDEKGRLVKRSNGRETFSYAYDSTGRLSEKRIDTKSDRMERSEVYRYEYTDDTMTIYLSVDGSPEALSRQFTYDANGNETKAVLDMGEYSDAQRITESEYDSENRLVKRTESITEEGIVCLREYAYDGDRLVKEVINDFKGNGVTTLEYFYENDRLIKETRTYEGEINEVTGDFPGVYVTEYCYTDRGYSKCAYNADGIIESEWEYTLINVIDTGIEYCEYFQSAEPDIIPEKGRIIYEYTDRNGYIFYCTEDRLYVKKGYFDIAAMDITEERSKGFYVYNLKIQPDFNCDEMPPAFALPRDALTYDVYFLKGNELVEAEWYLDGEKLDGVDYTLLECYGDGENFTAYSNWSCEKYRIVSISRHTFSFDRENLRFEGITEPAPLPQSIAADVMERYDEFFYAFYNAPCDGGTDGYLKISAEGYRTRSELMTTLGGFCTEAAAEGICDYLFGSSNDFKEIDGELYLYDSAPNLHNSVKYLHSETEENGVVKAVFFSCLRMQDAPHKLDFFQVTIENGKLTVLDS